jgi:hypothetical protein
MGAFTGTSLTLLIDQNGEIKDVQGKEAFRDQVTHSMDSIMSDGDYTEKSQVSKSMEQFYDKGQLQGMLGTMFAVYTNEPVQTGSSWTKETSTVLNDVKTKMKTKYTLVAVKDGMAEIKMEGEMTGAGVTSESGAKAEVEMDGKQTGTMSLQLDNGHVKSSETKMEMEGKVKTAGFKIPMKMKAVYTIIGK